MSTRRHTLWASCPAARPVIAQILLARIGLYMIVGKMSWPAAFTASLRRLNLQNLL